MWFRKNFYFSPLLRVAEGTTEGLGFINEWDENRKKQKPGDMREKDKISGRHHISEESAFLRNDEIHLSSSGKDVWDDRGDP